VSEGVGVSERERESVCVCVRARARRVCECMCLDVVVRAMSTSHTRTLSLPHYSRHLPITISFLLAPYNYGSPTVGSVTFVLHGGEALLSSHDLRLQGKHLLLVLALFLFERALRRRQLLLDLPGD
jgi:hypothetical protein